MQISNGGVKNLRTMWLQILSIWESFWEMFLRSSEDGLQDLHRPDMYHYYGMSVILVTFSRKDPAVNNQRPTEEALWPTPPKITTLFWILCDTYSLAFKSTSVYSFGPLSLPGNALSFSAS